MIFLQHNQWDNGLGPWPRKPRKPAKTRAKGDKKGQGGVRHAPATGSAPERESHTFSSGEDRPSGSGPASTRSGRNLPTLTIEMIREFTTTLPLPTRLTTVRRREKSARQPAIGKKISPSHVFAQNTRLYSWPWPSFRACASSVLNFLGNKIRLSWAFGDGFSLGAGQGYLSRPEPHRIASNCSGTPF
jgi:hypothetical protein